MLTFYFLWLSCFSYFCFTVVMNRWRSIWKRGLDLWSLTPWRLLKMFAQIYRYLHIQVLICIWYPNSSSDFFSTRILIFFPFGFRGLFWTIMFLFCNIVMSRMMEKYKGQLRRTRVQQNCLLEMLLLRQQRRIWDNCLARLARWLLLEVIGIGNC